MATKKKPYSNVQVVRTKKQNKKKQIGVEDTPSFFEPSISPTHKEIRSAERIAAKQMLKMQEDSSWRIAKKFPIPGEKLIDDPESRRFFIHGGTQGRDTRPNLTDVEDASDIEFAHTFRNMDPSRTGGDTSSRIATTELRAMLDPFIRNSPSAELGWQILTRGTSGKEDIEAIAAIIAYYKRRIGNKLEKSEVVDTWRYRSKSSKKNQGNLKADAISMGVAIPNIPKGSKPADLESHWKFNEPLVREYHKQMQILESLSDGTKKWVTKKGFPGGGSSVGYLEGTDISVGMEGLKEWLRGGGLAVLRHELQHVGDSYLEDKYFDNKNDLRFLKEDLASAKATARKRPSSHYLAENVRILTEKVAAAEKKTLFPLVQDPEDKLLYPAKQYDFFGQDDIEYQWNIDERAAFAEDAKAFYALRDDPNVPEHGLGSLGREIGDRELKNPKFMKMLEDRDALAVKALEEDFGIYGYNLPYRIKQRKQDAEAISKGRKKDAVSNLIREYDSIQFQYLSRFLDPSEIVMNTGEWDARLNRPEGGDMPVDVMEGTEQNPRHQPKLLLGRMEVPWRAKYVGRTTTEYGKPVGSAEPDPYYRSFPRQPGEVQLKRTQYSVRPRAVDLQSEMIYNKGGTVKKRKKVKRNKVQKKQYSSSSRSAKYKR